MPRSMTGYGRGEAVSYDRRFVAEVKAVNHRYSDINIKMPRVLNPFEDRLRKKVAARAARGKVDVYITMESLAAGDIKISLNTPLADAYAEQLRAVSDRYGLQGGGLALLMNFPNVLETDKKADEAALSEMGEGAEAALEAALCGFMKMREAEGAELAGDILKKLQAVSALVGQVAARAPEVLAEYRARLRAKLEETLADANIDESRILAEAVIFSDKSCVDEELTRLASHLKQFEAILGGNGAVGRKLDFLIQEINREINTVGSKSNDLEVTRLVVELKTEAEKIREQVQNLE